MRGHQLKHNNHLNGLKMQLFALLVAALTGVAAQTGDVGMDLGSLLGGLGQQPGNQGVCSDNKVEHRS